MTDTNTMQELDIREKLAHIDEMLADIASKRQEIALAPARIEQMLADTLRKRQKVALAPWSMMLTFFAAGAGLFAAGAAFIKLIGG